MGHPVIIYYSPVADDSGARQVGEYALHDKGVAGQHLEEKGRGWGDQEGGADLRGLRFRSRLSHPPVRRTRPSRGIAHDN